jgi:hypothetical protein
MKTLTPHEKEQRLARRQKRLRKKAAGLVEPTRREKLNKAIEALFKLGVPRKEVEDLVSASRPIFCNDSGVTWFQYEQILDRHYAPSENIPICEECDVEMERYEEAADTGKGGFRCPECGWSQDDE